MTLEMTDNNTVTIISESRNLRALSFRITEDQHSLGKEWKEWLDAIEREFRISELTVQLTKRCFNNIWWD